MPTETPYLRAILPSLPNDFAKKIRVLCSSSESSSAEYILDTLIRFISGAECGPDLTTDAQAQWSEKQRAATKILNDMIRPSTPDLKRQRDDDTEADSQASKRPRPSPENLQSSSTQEDALFTIHSISATSPVRKKVDITIHKSSITLHHATTHALEATIPLSSMTRAFLLPTRGKQKPHRTIVLLSSDSPERGKATNNITSSNIQVIFGLDAIAPSPLTTTDYTSSSTSPVISVTQKGSATLPSIRAFLSHLGIQRLEPTPDVFKSVCTGVGSGVSAIEDGVPGIEAYRGAKPGSLWFMKEGVLWGESKPCEFWAVEDLIGKSEGLRVVNASGRTCSVILTRKSSMEGDEVGDDGEDMGVETEFGMVDSREKTGIDAWVRTYRHLFGKKKVVGEPVTVGQIEEDSDEEDEDFEADSDDDSDSSSSSSSSEEGEGDNDEGDRDAGASDAAESGDGSDSEEEELKEKNHPLMRPGAMPRMNRAVIDMVVGMVEDDMMGGPAAGVPGDEDEDLEEDELDD